MLNMSMPLAVTLIVLSVAGLLVAMLRVNARRRAIHEITAKFAPVLPDERVELPVVDADRPFVLDVGAQPTMVPAHNLLLVEYTDAEGNKSRRRVTARSFAEIGDTDGVLSVYCHERRAMRTFYVSRITVMTDMKTGEVVTDPLQYFRELYPTPAPDFSGDAFNALEVELLILTYLARADSRMVKIERDAIALYVCTRYPDLTFDERRLDRRIARLHSDPPEFRWALKQVVKLPRSVRQRLLIAGTAVIQADNKSDAREQRVVALLASALNA